jgi:outer membrane murein-binding lipoprotein Lpp
VVTILAALGFGHVVSKQGEIQKTTAKIEEQTNGRISHLSSMLEKTQQDLNAANEQNARAMRDMADQHSRVLRDMADKMALMTPLASLPPTGPEDDHSSHL